jgi:hypothetical protein
MAVVAVVGRVGRVLRKLGHWVTQIPLVPPPPGATTSVHAALGPRILPLPAAGTVEQPALRLDVLSTEPLILEARDFITPAECNAVIEHAQTEGRPMMGTAGCGMRKFELSPWPSQHVGADDGGLANTRALLLESIYDRIDRIVGVVRYGDEVPPKVHHYQHASNGVAPSPTAAPHHDRMPLGLHVDTNAVGTYCTAILYLTTLAQPIADGATVFPCVQTGVTAASPASGGSAMPAGATPSSHPAEEEPRAARARHAGASLLLDEALHTDQATTASQCHVDVLIHDANAGHGLSVDPEAGKLVVFFTREDDGTVDPTSFHGGAAVRFDPAHPTHVGKWMMQLCKEIPIRARGLAASAAFVSGRRAHALLHTRR